jgi:hypothetical protein
LSRTSPRRAALLLAALCAAQLAAGCRGSREEREAALRARYRVEVAGFVIDQRPQAAPIDPQAAPAAPALAQDAVVDLQIRLEAPAGEGGDAGDAGERLDRLPVALVLAGPGGAVRGRWPAELEVAAAAPGGAPVRVKRRLAGVPFQPGDRFAVEIAAPSGTEGDAGRP